MKFKMNVPNALTIFRVLLVPPIIILIIMDSLPTMAVALGLFLLSAITDTLDGAIARKYNQTSEFGAFFDPIADKFLVWGVFTVFSLFTRELFIPIWLIAFIYLRDLFVTFLRSYSRRKKIKFKTSWVAKAKTLVQMAVAFMIMLYMLVTYVFQKLYAVPLHVNTVPAMKYAEIWKAVMPVHYAWMIYIPLALTALTVAFTFYTAVDYYLKFKNQRIGREEK
jgi:CDP-diacylglycerol---glycerol-3-phosphate 3-phosphatidyltransferase